MNTNASLSTPYISITDVLTLLLLIAAGAAIAGVKLPLLPSSILTSSRTGVIVLLVAGMALCTGGIGRVGAVNAWAHPISILGYIAGAAILVIAGAALLNKPLPLIADGRAAFTAMTALIAVKWLLILIHPAIH